ncbi:MAG: hypothetical protein RL030_1088 [Pseudomonadota bacterium]|jgi:hypothetical protein
MRALAHGLAPIVLSVASTLGVAGEERCAPHDGLAFICGAGAVEDLAPVPGTSYLLAGGMRFAEPAPIQLIDTVRRAITVAWPRTGAERPDRTNYPDCPGPPDPSRLSTTGVALQSLTPTSGRFYAVNEGDRRAIEVFDVATVATRTAPALPQLTWVGCIPMPADTNPNAVTPLDGRALAIVSMDDGSQDRMERHVAGDALGSVWIWRPVTGLKSLPGIRFRGGNGIAASADHRRLFVSAWSGAQLLRIAVDGSEAPQPTQLPFLPDNVKRQADGSLLVAAQRPPVARIARCQGPSCPADWLIARIDPATMRWTLMHEAQGSEAVNYATGAVEHDGRIWITNRGDGRIGVLTPRP